MALPFGSRPITKGAIARTAASIDAASAPLVASPQPTSPSSVVTRTNVGDAVAGDDRADLAVAIGDVDDDRLDEGDLHSVCSNLVRISLPPARTTNTCSSRMPPKPAA